MERKYQVFKNFINQNNCNMITTLEEFIELKNNNKKTVPSQLKLEIGCKCGNKFTRTFNEFHSQNKHLCLSCLKQQAHEKVYTKERIGKIISLYNNKKTMEEIAKIVKTKPETISNILKENNIEIRNSTSYRSTEELATNRKYTYNVDFFQEINNKYKAYWLGFLYADGNVYLQKGKSGFKSGTVEVTLKREDEYHLYNFNTDIGGNLLIEQRVITLNDKKYEASRLSISSKKMSMDLINHGCIPNKSLKLKFPNTVPENLLNHFIRGYIDGDGNIAFYTYEETDSFRISVLGTYEFLSSLKIFLEGKGIKSSNVFKSNSKAFILNFYGRDNLVKLYNYLYNDAGVFLGRKIDNFRKALIYFEKDFNITPTSKLFYLLDDDLQDKIYHKNVSRKFNKMNYK